MIKTWVLLKRDSPLPLIGRDCASRCGVALCFVWLPGGQCYVAGSGSRVLLGGVCMILLALRCYVVLGFVFLETSPVVALGHAPLFAMLVFGFLSRMTSVGLLFAVGFFICRNPEIWELTRPRPLQILAFQVACLLIVLAYGPGRASLDEMFHIRRLSAKYQD